MTSQLGREEESSLNTNNNNNNKNNIVYKNDTTTSLLTTKSTNALALSQQQQQEEQEDMQDDDDNDNDDNKDDASLTTTTTTTSQPLSIWQSWWQSLRSEYTKRPPPPLVVQDLDLVLFDIVLLVNLVVSIDVWVVHRRLQFFGGSNTIATAVSEGCLLSCCWLAAGVWTGAFLYSAVDGHLSSSSDHAGPPAAARLAVQTFVNAINLRLIIALVTAVVQHRPALDMQTGEALLPASLGLGLVLTPTWRWLHSNYTPRL